MPSFLNKILDLIIYSNTWVGITAACFSLLGSPFFETPPAFLTILFATQFLYSFQRLYKLKVLKVNLGNARQQWYEKHEKFMWFWTVANGVISSYLLLSVHQIVLSNWLSVLLCGAISIFYVVPFYKGLNLRNVPMTKGFLVTIVYTWFTLWLFNSHVVHDQGGYFILFGSLYVLAATVMFDWRDRKMDDKKIKTLPQLLGKDGSLMLVASLYLISITGFWVLRVLKEEFIVPMILIHLVAIAYIRKGQKNIVVSLIFEGLMALMGLATYLF